MTYSEILESFNQGTKVFSITPPEGDYALYFDRQSFLYDKVFCLDRRASGVLFELYSINLETYLADNNAVVTPLTPSDPDAQLFFDNVKLWHKISNILKRNIPDRKDMDKILEIIEPLKDKQE